MVDNTAIQAQPSELAKQEMKTEFAKALSAVVNESQEARELIKSEAQKQISTSEYQMRTYDTGHIKFGVSAY